MDAFELLGLPRRPWLDPTEVRTAFQRRARDLHPDAETGDADAFVRLNAAYRDLVQPATRLRHLLGDAAVPELPPDVSLGFAVGALLREADALLEKRGEASSPLSRALLAGKIAAVRRRLEELAGQVNTRVAEAEERLRSLDLAWPNVPAGELAALAGAFLFLERWTTQLRARMAELSA